MASTPPSVPSPPALSPVPLETPWRPRRRLSFSEQPSTPPAPVRARARAKKLRGSAGSTTSKTCSTDSGGELKLGSPTFSEIEAETAPSALWGYSAATSLRAFAPTEIYIDPSERDACVSPRSVSPSTPPDRRCRRTPWAPSKTKNLERWEFEAMTHGGSGEWAEHVRIDPGTSDALEESCTSGMCTPPVRRSFFQDCLDD